MPESLARVQKLTGKTLSFYEADLLDKESLKAVMKKVTATSMRLLLLPVVVTRILVVADTVVL